MNWQIKHYSAKNMKWMKQKVIMLTEVSQAQRQKAHDITHMLNQKKLISQKLRVE
jgi:hypothetical protein